MTNNDESTKGAVSIAVAIDALRDELVNSLWRASFPHIVDGKEINLRFKPAPIELTLQVAVTNTGKINAGVKWWLITAGGELSRQSVTTQTIKLTLDPTITDNAGNNVEVAIDAAEIPARTHSDLDASRLATE